MITDIDRYFVGNPNIVGITTTDDLATITSAGYLETQQPVINKLINGNFQWQPSDLVLIYYAGNAVGLFTMDATTNAFVIFGSGMNVTPQQVQQSAFNTGTDTGVADAYIVDLSPAVTSYTDDLIVIFNPLNTNATSSPTLQINALSPVPIYTLTGYNVLPGDLESSYTNYVLIYSSNFGGFLLINPTNSLPNTEIMMINGYTTGVDGGVVNAYTIGVSIPSKALFNSGATYTITSVLNTNTGASTLAIVGNGDAPIPIVLANGNPLSGGEMIAGQSYYFFISSIGAILMNPSV